LIKNENDDVVSYGMCINLFIIIDLYYLNTIKIIYVLNIYLL